MTSHNNLIQFIPLGGFGEIGMNCLVIRANAKILIVDCGVLFPAEPRMGVDTIHASFEYLLHHRKKICGLVATHGHEDHIAAIPFLLNQIDVPIYAGAYTNGLLRSRFNEFENLNQPQLITIQPGIPFQIGEFSVTPLKMPHSTEDNFALVIDWRGQRIFHTSDFKLNMNSKAEKRHLIEELKAIQPVDVMVTDSTGALESTDAGDEAALKGSIGELVNSAPGRVFIALFSSNIQRIETFIRIAKSSGRKLVMSGRSVLNHFAIAKEAGIISSAEDIVVPAQKAHLFHDDELIILMSGTQGESRSALGRFAANKHAQFTPGGTDTVILSSRFIPGNELQISQTISRLMAQQVTVFHSNNRDDIHVSGHGSKNEIRMAMEAVSPKVLLPAHGTFEHMKATANIASELGIPTLVAVNGDTVSFTEGDISISNRTDVGRVFIENGKPVPDEVLKDRRKIGSCGVIVLWVTLVHPEQSEDKPDVTVRQHSAGVVPDSEYQRIAPEIVRIVQDTVYECAVTHPQLAQQIRTAVRKFMRKEFRRNPIIVISCE